MRDDRKEARVLVLKTGRIVGTSADSSIDCAVLNVSASGACILVPPRAAIPTAFALAIDENDTLHDCVLMWRDGARLGVRFASTEDAVHDERSPDGSEQARGRADPF